MKKYTIKAGIQMLKYEEYIEWSDTDFDDAGSIKSSSLMYAFQEIAAVHATNLNLGFDDMISHNNIWVLSKLRFKVYGEILKDRRYRLETYPRPKKGIKFFRDYYLYDEDNLISAGTSHWCIINFETRKVERTKLDFDGEFIDYEPFEGGIEKIKADNLKEAGSYEVTEDDIDINRHVNNCRYADMVDRAVCGMKYNDFNIHFAKEAKLGDNIKLYTGKMDDWEVIIGKSDDETTVFQAKVRKIETDEDINKRL